MPAFVFPEFTMIAYGKTGSTSLNELVSQTPEAKRLTPNNIEWEPVSGADWNRIPADRPCYIVTRAPERRLISGIQMFLQVRYCDNQIVSPEVNLKWAKMQAEPNPYQGHFLRTLKELWSNKEFWQYQIPSIFDLFRNELFGADTGMQQWIHRQGYDAKDFERFCHNQGMDRKSTEFSNWQDIFTQKLSEERYHMGNYLTYVDKSRLSGYLDIADLDQFLTGKGYPKVHLNSNNNRGYHIAPGSLWSTEEQNIINRCQREAITDNTTWNTWRLYLEPENIAWADIQTQVPNVGLEPAATENRSINKHRSSND